MLLLLGKRIFVSIAILFTGCFVHCRKFVESRVLMLIFGSLSCADAEIRALGYYCLSQFYSQLESENFREKSIWICLLESLRNSITSVNPRLPCIITLFLARVVNIFTKPGMCGFITQFNVLNYLVLFNWCF